MVGRHVDENETTIKSFFLERNYKIEVTNKRIYIDETNASRALNETIIELSDVRQTHINAPLKSKIWIALIFVGLVLFFIALFSHSAARSTILIVSGAALFAAGIVIGIKKPPYTFTITGKFSKPIVLKVRRYSIDSVHILQSKIRQAIEAENEPSTQAQPVPQQPATSKSASEYYAPHVQIIEKKEIITMIRCAHCNSKYNEELSACPNCGSLS